jgi:2-methylaconitate cis-trans-isomerase PrpF
MAVLPPGPRRMIVIEHPSGTLETEFELATAGDTPVIRRAAFVRTARKIMSGMVYVPGSVWSGQDAVKPAKAA